MIRMYRLLACLGSGIGLAVLSLIHADADSGHWGRGWPLPFFESSCSMPGDSDLWYVDPSGLLIDMSFHTGFVVVMLLLARKFVLRTPTRTSHSAKATSSTSTARGVYPERAEGESKGSLSTSA